VFNSTPFERYNHEVETFYPVTLAILILKIVLLVNDTTNERKPETRVNLRKKFVQNDGLKYLFGVKVSYLNCSNCDDFSKIKVSDYIKE